MEGEFLELVFLHAVKQDLPAVYRTFLFKREMGEDWFDGVGGEVHDASFAGRTRTLVGTLVDYVDIALADQAVTATPIEYLASRRAVSDILAPAASRFRIGCVADGAGVDDGDGFSNRYEVFEHERSTEVLRLL
jgi:hypothetical protein